MRLVSLYHPEWGATWGFVSGTKVVGVGRTRDGETLSRVLREHDPERLKEEITRRLKYRQSDAESPVPQFDLHALDVAPGTAVAHLLIPIDAAEVWGCGVTYRRSAAERDADAKKDIYTQVYESVRPEVFFKATARCCVGPNAAIGIRCDSRLTAAEPELAVVLGSRGSIVGYTICNDVSAWDIERANPLYLPQSKTFLGCCAIGPVVVTADEIADPYSLEITCRIWRSGALAYTGVANTSQIGRKIEDLVAYLTRNNPVPIGTVLTTGTGIMVPNEYALRDGDRVEIEIEGIGVLRNTVRQLPGP